MSLYAINLQISSIQQSIDVLNYRRIQKREALARLEKILSEVSRFKGDYDQNRKLWRFPELASNTWNGKRATDFQSFRDGEVRASYQSITDRQLERRMSMLENEIEKTKQEIGDIGSQLTSQKTRLSHLQARRREELLK
ncbi:hypothetical protein [Oceanobacillus saliphilus]|uniref:hypothetical protein n=1 Tax=Oceanobacillus saliphilus TaxID=2925834 RepID=UPI00201D3934|nr:hypothetical protein [Oceanobacillus saliphilus]